MPRTPRRVYHCYLIVSQKNGRTYIGYTSDPKRRLRQHNGIIEGGARSTHANRPYRLHCVISGFTSRGQAMRFEYFWKRNSKGVDGRMKRAANLLEDPEWAGMKMKVV